MGNRLKEIIVSLTDRCNLRCAMCQIPLKESPELSTEEIRNLITDMVTLHPSNIVFSGGEPLLREDIFDLISFASSQKINTCLTSNGTLITDAVARRLSQAHVGVVNISIDGPQEVHDSMRGRGNFKKAVQALEYLFVYKVEATLATMVSSKNYRNLTSIMELAHRYKVTTVKFQPFSDIFLMDKTKGDEFFLPRSAFGEIESAIDKVIELSGRYTIATNPAHYLKSIPSYLCGVGIKRRPLQCDALFSSCSVCADGKVLVCWMNSEVPIGNLKEKKLSLIWNSGIHNRLRKDVRSEKCQGCLMSCYDYNFKETSMAIGILNKTKKIAKIKFTKRNYFRFYQYLNYLFAKIMRKISHRVSIGKHDDKEMMRAHNEIEQAKALLYEKLRTFKK